MLTQEQVLADAKELVTDLVTDLEAKGLTGQEGLDALEAAKQIFIKSVEIINAMIYGVDTTKH